MSPDQYADARGAEIADPRQIQSEVARPLANSVVEGLRKVVGPVTVQPSLDLQLQNIAYALFSDFHSVCDQNFAQSRSTRARFLDEPLGKSYPQLACDVGIQDKLFNHDIFEGQVFAASRRVTPARPSWRPFDKFFASRSPRRLGPPSL